MNLHVPRIRLSYTGPTGYWNRFGDYFRQHHRLPKLLKLRSTKALFFLRSLRNLFLCLPIRPVTCSDSPIFPAGVHEQLNRNDCNVTRVCISIRGCGYGFSLMGYQTSFLSFITKQIVISNILLGFLSNISRDVKEFSLSVLSSLLLQLLLQKAIIKVEFFFRECCFTFNRFAFHRLTVSVRYLFNLFQDYYRFVSGFRARTLSTKM